MPFIQFQFRRGTTAQWAAANTVLAAGEMGIDTDTDQFKIGNGTTGWNSLPYGGIVGPQGPQGNVGPQGNAGAGFPTGGATGQVLIKNSSANYDTDWTSSLTSLTTVSASGNITGNYIFTQKTCLIGTIAKPFGQGRHYHAIAFKYQVF